jgi:ribulose 1,5-bisphosphate synthetase/thiazole synthase
MTAGIEFTAIDAGRLGQPTFGPMLLTGGELARPYCRRRPPSLGYVVALVKKP